MIGLGWFCITPGCNKPTADVTHDLVDEHGQPMAGFVYCTAHLLEQWRASITRLTFLEAQLTAQLDRETSDQPALFDEDAR